MSEDTKRVLLGRISGAHGIRGDVIVRSFTENPASIGDYGALSNEDGSATFKLSVKRVSSKGVITRVKGVDDRNGAEALKGVELYVSRDQLGEPAGGAFFYTDLIGLSAVDVEGLKVGDVVGVDNFGAGDLLEVRLTGRKQTEYIAFTHDFVPEVDVDGGRVVIVLPFSDDEGGKD